MHLKSTRIRRGEKVYVYGQLVESYRREDGQPTQRVLANLGRLSELEISNLQVALGASRQQRAVVVPAAENGQGSCEVLDNLAWLDVAVVIGVLRRLGVDKILADVLPRGEAEVPDGDVVLSLVTQRCVAPGSKLAATEWFGRTSLPELLDFSPERFNNTRVHRALSGLEACEEALQARLASAISADHGPFSLLFLDLTDTWFVGRGPSLATRGKTKEGLYRRKIGISLLCDQDGYPLRWAVLEGRTQEARPMMEIATSLQSVDWARGVPLVFDRAMGASAHIEELLASKRPFVTALRRNEFDAYTDRLPWASVAELPWSGADAIAQAAEAVVKAGMTRVSDKRYVLDLGVVTRAMPVAPSARPMVNTSDKCHDRLTAARAMRADLDTKRAKNLTEAGLPHGLSAESACQAMRLLRLAQDVQESIIAGEAATLSIQDIYRLTRIDDPDAQRRAYDAVLDAARSNPDGRRAQKTGPLSAAPPLSEPEPSPPQVRAVVSFNPEQWVMQKETSDRRLAEIRTWTRRRNEAMREPGSKTTDASAATHAAHVYLEGLGLVEAFKVSTHMAEANGRIFPQLSIEPEPTRWSERQRFHGFQVIVARPDEALPPADLVAVYYSKDGVEKDFQTIKSVLSLRPVRHRTDEKVRAHVTVCMLALLVERAIERALKKTSTAASALDSLADIHLNRLMTPTSSTPVYAITRPKAEHLAILQALGLSALADNTKVTASLNPR